MDKSQEAIEKAEQLHKELNEMIKAQKDRQHEEAQRPIGSGLVQFFKASKPEMFNIFFAFVCGECHIVFHMNTDICIYGCNIKSIQLLNASSLPPFIHRMHVHNIMLCSTACISNSQDASRDQKVVGRSGRKEGRN